MNIKDFINYQENFDKKHISKFEWNKKINDSNIETLEFLLISIFGEIGEASNLVKKIVRGDFLLSEKKEELSEEIADVFIYLIKICNQLDIDLEKEYLKKMKKNDERFKKYQE